MEINLNAKLTRIATEDSIHACLDHAFQTLLVHA